MTGTQWLVALLVAGAAPSYAQDAFGQSSVSVSGTPIEVTERDDGLAVEMWNRPVNHGSRDDGEYTLSHGGAEITVFFTWNTHAGADSVDVIPPPGYFCEPASCRATVAEWDTGEVILRPGGLGM